MEYKELHSGFSMPSLGLGTWRIGGAREPDYSNDQEEITGIKEAINLGYTLIDTAEMYGGGHTEELIGEAIKGMDRSRLFIISKVLDTHLKYEEVISAAKRSLARMGTDYMDLYLIHMPNFEVIEETMRAMDYLVEQGMTRYIGVSNFTVEQMIEAQKYAKNKIVVNQVELSLGARNIARYGDNHDMESKTLPYCQENDIIVMAERPLERGLLLKPHPVLDAMELKYNKTKAQIALNWLISKKNVVAIPKSSSKQHLEENLGALGWRLDEEDMKLLDVTEFERVI